MSEYLQQENEDLRAQVAAWSLKHTIAENRAERYQKALSTLMGLLDQRYYEHAKQLIREILEDPC